MDGDAFVEKMPIEMSGTWAEEHPRALATNALQGSGENYHVVATSRGDPTRTGFLIVASRDLCESKKTEIHIYIVKMILRHYGDPLTSRLLKARSTSACNSGFLFLERTSQFKAGKVREIFRSRRISQGDQAPGSRPWGVAQPYEHDPAGGTGGAPHGCEICWTRSAGPRGGPRVREMMACVEAARSKLYAAAQGAVGAQMRPTSPTSGARFQKRIARASRDNGDHEPRVYVARTTGS